jgi:hypothetical protein
MRRIRSATPLRRLPFSADTEPSNLDGGEMAKKLGEMLVDEGLITQSQLEEALRTQQQYSGKLGTNLVEHGYLSQSALAKFLSAQLGIPSVEASELESIPQEVLDVLPVAIAEEHGIVPVRIDKRELQVAMADPTDLGMLDDIGFQIGYTILPSVAPELLITFALERHYDIVRKCRYLRLSGVVDQEFEVLRTSDANENEPAEAAKGPEPVALEEVLVASYSTQQIATDLAAANDQNDVYRVMCKLFSRDFEQCVAFAVQGTEVRGYFRSGCSVTAQELREVQFPVQQIGCICRANESWKISVGAPEDSEGLGATGERIGFRVGSETLIVPILVNNHVRIIVLANGNKVDPISPNLRRYEDFRKKLSYAVQMVSLRARILE